MCPLEIPDHVLILSGSTIFNQVGDTHTALQSRAWIMTGTIFLPGVENRIIELIANSPMWSIRKVTPKWRNEGENQKLDAL